METPAELRERARLFREAAAAEPDSAKRSSLAERAFALAQRAEANARSLTSEPAVNPPADRRAIRFRDKAEELRTLAEQAKSPETRAMLLRMADSYENLAAFADGTSADMPGSATG